MIKITLTLEIPEPKDAYPKKWIDEAYGDGSLAHFIDIFAQRNALAYRATFAETRVAMLEREIGEKNAELRKAKYP